MSSAGFPFAISKITSEYNALGYKRAVKDTYGIAVKLISVIAIFMFVILFVFAPEIGKLIIGNAMGKNMISDVSFIIRMVSFAILVVPFLSVTKGFLQGYKYITPYSISQVIEQVVRVIVILVGSYVCVRIFNLPLRYAVGIAVSGAFFGGLVAYIYLKVKIKQAKLLPKVIEEDKISITKREIVKKIITYSVPFILISLVNNLYTTVDMILLSRSLSDILGYETKVVESIVGVYTTWGIKLNNVILAVSTGLVTSLIPNIVASFTKNDMRDVNIKFNKALQCVLLVIVPVTLFFSLLAGHMWTLFYGKSYYGPIVYKAFVFTALFGGVYTIIVNTLQGINKYKLVMITVILGLVINGVLDVPFIMFFDSIGLNASYGAVMADLVGYSISIFMALFVLEKKYKFRYRETLKLIPKYIISWIVFVLVIFLMKMVIPNEVGSRLLEIPVLMLFGIVSFGIYFVISYMNGNLEMVFGSRIKGIFKKFKRN
jgi:O-antigen/teichoic acid export membrane protein